MKWLISIKTQSLLTIVAVALLALPMHKLSAHGGAIPKKVPVLFGSLPEGFAIGRRSTAFSGSVDGSIYKVNLRSGEGETMVEAEEDFDIDTQCFKLGMRVDPRTNYLFVAGCQGGNAYVFDADNGALLMEYQLPLPPGSEADTFQIVNDLVITRHAVYFTDAHQPLLYRLPLSKNGELPPADAVTAIKLTGDFVNIDPADGCCGANGIVAVHHGETLIIGHSNFAQLFRVDPDTGMASEIVVENSPLTGFLDGIVLRNRKLYILTPSFDPETTPDMVQVVKLDRDMRTGELMQPITDPDMDGVASGAFLGNALYVNNARYFSELVSEKWITRLNIRRKKK